MAFEIFMHRPGGQGDHGSDWERIRRTQKRGPALAYGARIAIEYKARVYVMTAPKRGVGVLVQEFPAGFAS